jgi:acetylglutamate kinase
VNVAPIRKLLKQGIIPVITPLGLGPDGKIHNVNADSSAAAVAKALRARKLVFLTDVPGLLRDREDPESIITTLRAGEVEGLVARGVIDGGMLPKVNSGLEALKYGVNKIHMIDGRMPHSLLLEIFTDKGVGTEIVADEQK